ncbi:MAG: prephenate dehydrogenase/arogenate dehydrogenase family protein, partial [Betaproteobacteria bacterium]|nr:prephenate dehydrogenase/arogenate dehydrogenase family protein [Betaproteobacteria bacterium]
DVWRDILSANQSEVLKQTGHFRAALDAFEKAIQHNDLDQLQRLIEQASRVRSGWALQTGSEEHDD